MWRKKVYWEGTMHAIIEYRIHLLPIVQLIHIYFFFFYLYLIFHNRSKKGKDLSKRWIKMEWNK